VWAMRRIVVAVLGIAVAAAAATQTSPDSGKDVTPSEDGNLSIAFAVLQTGTHECVYGPRIFMVRDIPSPAGGLGGLGFGRSPVSAVGGSPPPPVSEVRRDWPWVAFTRAGGNEIAVVFGLEEYGAKFEARGSLSPLERKAIVLYLAPKGSPKYTLLAMLLDNKASK